MPELNVSLNVYSQLEQNAETGELFGARSREVAFRSNQYTKETAKSVKANMAEFIAKAEDPNDPSIQYDVPFMLPCILRKARPEDPSAARVNRVMQVDGTWKDSTAVAPAPAPSGDDDNPF